GPPPAGPDASPAAPAGRGRGATEEAWFPRDRRPLRAAGRGGHPDPEGEAPAADMAVIPGHGPPGACVGPIPQRTEGTLQLERLAGHGPGLAGLDRPAVGVQYLDCGQSWLWAFGEGEGDLPGCPIERCPVGG